MQAIPFDFCAFVASLEQEVAQKAFEQEQVQLRDAEWLAFIDDCDVAFDDDEEAMKALMTSDIVVAGETSCIFGD